jgi:hypothetical protein
MPDRVFDQLYPLACEHLAPGGPDPAIMRELKRARDAEARLQKELKQANATLERVAAVVTREQMDAILRPET